MFKRRFIAAAFFSVYDTMKKTLPLTEELAPMNHMISASVGEIVCHLGSPHYLIIDSLFSIFNKSACMIRVPTEVIKTRTQTSSYGAAHASSVAAMKIVFRNEGINGFYRGFGITVIREAGIYSHNISSEKLLTALSRSHSHPSSFPSMNFSN